MVRKLRVGFNALAWLPGFSGGDGSYIRHLSAALSELAEIELVVFAAPWNAPFFLSLKGVATVVCPLHTHSFVERAIWEQVRLPAWIGRANVDLFHATVNVAPVRCRVPLVLSVHDVTPFAAAQTLPLPLRIYWRTLRRASIRRANRIIAMSAHNLRELQRYVHVPSGRCEAIPLGVDPVFSLNAPALQPGYPYLLWVGRPYPTKNVPQLLRVFRQVGEGELDFPYHLHLVGPAGWDDAAITALCNADAWLNPRVHRLPYQAPEVLSQHYLGATALVYPSLDESFALPLVEAMAAGTPVICSDAGAMPEVVGDAAQIFHAGDDASLAQALNKVLINSEHRQTLRTLGLARAARFTWQRTAQRTLACYWKAVASRQ